MYIDEKIEKYIESFIILSRFIEQYGKLYKKGINIFGFDCLFEIISFLEKTKSYQTDLDFQTRNSFERVNLLDFEDVHGPDSIVEYMLAAAAGSHNFIIL